jgi:dinuclear metal center YbgI/SA1388 family protein
MIELISFLYKLLDPSQFKDYTTNGLQIQCESEVKKLVVGVTACEALIDAAIEQNADAILVHHGYFWKGEADALVGPKYQRIKKLIQNNIALLAYHLPLDAHLEHGNNVQLAELLKLKNVQGIGPDKKQSIVFMGEYTNALSLQGLGNQIEKVLNRPPLLIEGHDRPIAKLALCTGAADSFIELAAEAGADAFLSGEISERTTHLARELGIHYIAAGHHATERLGVQTVGKVVGEQFDLAVEFIDVDNPV